MCSCVRKKNFAFNSLKNFVAIGFENFTLVAQVNAARCLTVSNRMQTLINNLKYNRKSRYIMAISFILTIILLILINSSFADDNPEIDIPQQSVHEDWHFVCIVDAGSTGSRIHVYKYLKSDDDEQDNGLIKVDIKNEKYQKFYPGLSSFEDKPTDYNAMGDYLDPILNFGRDNVPLSKRMDTPLFVLASAGMRKVRDRNTKTAQQIMDMAYKYLSESEFIVIKTGVKIIEGRDEGLWGWIAANYLNGELANLLKIKNINNIYTAQTTKGVLEMGGESLQITFIPQDSSLNELKSHNHGDALHHLETVNIGDVEFQLFTYSWMVLVWKLLKISLIHILLQLPDREMPLHVIFKVFFFFFHFNFFFFFFF